MKPSLMLFAGTATLALALACGGGGGDLPAPAAHAGTVGFLTQDAPSEDWSQVGLIIRRASLVLAGDAAAAHPVVIYDGSGDTAPVNLLQEDQVCDLLGQAAGVPAGTYDRLIVEVDGTPGNVTLVPAPDPGGTAAPAPVPSSQIIVRGATGSQPSWKALPAIALAAPLVVTDGSASAVSVDFDLAHPAFIVEHDVATAAGSSSYFVVNLGARGIVRHAPAAALDQYVLRRHLGTVTSVAAGGGAFTLRTEHGQALTVQVDPASPALFHNLDVHPVAAVAAATVPATLAPGLSVACSARYLAGGGLAAVRVWYGASATALPSWTPEGHILKVDRANHLLSVLDGQGQAKVVAVTAATRWFWRGDIRTDLAAGDGLGFLDNVERFFKVAVTVADPTATPMVATTVDIQRAVFEGRVTAADASGFTYQKTFADLSTASHAIGYQHGAFAFWNFTFPGQADASVPDFLAQAASGIVLDTSGTTFKPYASSTLAWAGGWQARNAVFMPVPLSGQAQTLTTGYADGSLQVQGRGPNAVPVTATLAATGAEQPLVTTFTRQAGVVTVATVEPGQWASVLTAGTKVRVYGVPDRAGKLKVYYVNVYL